MYFSNIFSFSECKFYLSFDRFISNYFVFWCYSKWFSSVQFSSVAQSCPTLCDPTDCSMPGLPIHHQLPEFTQTHVRWVGDAMQTSHPLLSPSSPDFNLSQHQGLQMSQLFASGGQSISERVTGRKARGLQMGEIACKYQILLSLLSSRRKQTSGIFFSIQI